MPAYQYVYVMKGLSRTYPGGREVLKGITLSFFPGAKIGVIGVNGSGKSTLLRIMAGLDHDFVGRGLGGGRRQGRLSAAGAAARSGQDGAGERHARSGADQGAARPVQRDQRPLRRAARRRRDGGAAGGAGRAAGEDRRRERLGAGAHHRDRHGRAALPARRRRSRDALRRRAEARGAVPAAAGAPGPAAARRADQPPRRGIRRLAGALPQGLLGHGDGGHPRPLLSRQRHRLDSGARSRPRHPLRGQLLVVAGAEAAAARRRGEAGDGAAAHARPRARLDPRQPARPAGEVEGAHPGVRDPLRRVAGARPRHGADRRSRPARASARW